MGDTDIVMGNVDTTKPSLPYGTPYPPRLEATHQTSDGRFEPTDWARHARHYGARDHPNGNGFEVQPLNTGTSNNLNVQYRLGPPSSSVKWNSVIEKWGLQVLDKAGFINLDSSLNAKLANSYMHPTGRFASTRNPSDKKPDRVHPIFRKDMWTNLSQRDYDTIMPALLLASAFLDDPTTLCLFHAISAPADQMITFQDPNLKTCKRLQVPETLTEPEQWAVFSKLCDLCKWTEFYWEQPHMLRQRGALGFCQPLTDNKGRNISASGPHTRRSKIGLSIHYLEVLRGCTSDKDTAYNLSRKKARKYFDETLRSTGVPVSHRPSKTCIDSAGLRTAFLFATLLVHELAHAYSFAYFKRANEKEPREPWVADNRSNELGHAITNFILGGSPYASSFSTLPSSTVQKDFLKDSVYAQFGLYFANKWKQWDSAGDAIKEQFLKQGLGEDRSVPLTFWPVSQRQVYDYFNEELWEERVPRYGLEALKMVKVPGWKSCKYPGPDPDNPWNGSTLK